MASELLGGGERGPLSPSLSAELVGIEGMLLGSRGEVARVLIRVQRRQISAAQYAALVEWAGYLRVQRGLSQATAGNYVDALAEFLEWLNERGTPLEFVAAADVDDWHKHLAIAQCAAGRTRNVKLTAVRRFYAWRELLGHGPSPVRAVPGPKRERRQPRKYTTPQLRALLASCDRSTVIGRRDVAVLLFFYATGARRMEVCGLELDQLELRERVGTVRFRGKGAKERSVKFEGPAVTALRDWLADRDQLPAQGTASVFVGVRGNRAGLALRESGLNGVLDRAVKAARLRLEPGMALHTLRVTFATDLYDMGVDLETIRHLMGHEDIETTRQYIAISEKRLRTRMPAARLNELTGGRNGGLPIWAREKQRGLF